MHTAPSSSGEGVQQGRIARMVRVILITNLVLEHHVVILVLEVVAMEHVDARLALEGHGDGPGAIAGDHDDVLPTVRERSGRYAVDVELYQVNVHGVGMTHHHFGGEGPTFRIAPFDLEVGSVGIVAHILDGPPSSRRVVQPEGTGFGGAEVEVVGNERRWWRVVGDAPRDDLELHDIRKARRILSVDIPEVQPCPCAKTREVDEDVEPLPRGHVNAGPLPPLGNESSFSADLVHNVPQGSAGRPHLEVQFAGVAAIEEAEAVPCLFHLEVGGVDAVDDHPVPRVPRTADQVGIQQLVVAHGIIELIFRGEPAILKDEGYLVLAGGEVIANIIVQRTAVIGVDEVHSREAHDNVAAGVVHLVIVEPVSPRLLIVRKLVRVLTPVEYEGIRVNPEPIRVGDGVRLGVPVERRGNLEPMMVGGQLDFVSLGIVPEAVHVRQLEVLALLDAHDRAGPLAVIAPELGS
mmetsp:Transcript_48940/g.147434  ORF Transcript_48940/g.147434 Transcript_48940/m.147434 type:complete len:464 (+) Transcript_48940:191-1582(+)